MLLQIKSFFIKIFLLFKMKFDTKYQFHDLSFFVDKELFTEEKKTNSLAPGLDEKTMAFWRQNIFGYEYDNNYWTIEESIKHHNAALAALNKKDPIKYYFMMPAYYIKCANGNWSIVSIISCESHTSINYPGFRHHPEGFKGEHDRLDVLGLEAKFFSVSGFPVDKDVVLGRIKYINNNIN